VLEEGELDNYPSIKISNEKSIPAYCLFDSYGNIPLM
jgi:hypothetical protein